MFKTLKILVRITNKIGVQELETVPGKEKQSEYLIYFAKWHHIVYHCIMDKTKNGSQPAPGAETPPVAQYREMIRQDLRTARVLCHLVSKDPSVSDAVWLALRERMQEKGYTVDKLQAEAETAFTFLTYALETSVLLDSVAEVTQGLADNYKQKKDASMGNPGGNARG